MRKGEWDYNDSQEAERQGWYLHHAKAGQFYMPYVHSRRHGATYCNRPIDPTEEQAAFSRILEAAVCGDEVAQKALRLIVQTHTGFAEYANTVTALAETYCQDVS